MTASEAMTIAWVWLNKYIAGLWKESGRFTNPDIERWILLEDEARGKYEHYTNQQVTEVGFIEVDEFTGCSPDWLVWDEGGIEIKCPNDNNYAKILEQGIGAVSKRYIYQIQMNLLITGRQWWDYVAYNPNFDCEMCIYRIYPDALLQGKIQDGINKWIELIKWAYTK